MITEDEAFWAGIAVAVMMLGGGFSMLFLQAFTGFGSVVLALGLMTMAFTIQMRAKPIEQYEPPTPYESQILTPTPVVSPKETEVETEQSPKSSQVEVETEQSPSEPTEEPTEEARPTETPEQIEPAEQVEPTSTEPTQPIEQPPPTQAPIEEKTEPPKSEEKPKEEPQVVAAAS